MSQTSETPGQSAGQSIDVLDEIRKAKNNIRQAGASIGPSYNGDDTPNTSFWYDQVFERGVTPSGTVNCSTPLYVGKNALGMYVALNASPGNAGKLAFPASATVTMSLAVADDPDGEFEAAGPTQCVTAPTGGLGYEPGDTVLRLALADLPKPWVKVKLVFSGSITGGTLACGLGKISL